MNGKVAKIRILVPVSRKPLLTSLFAVIIGLALIGENVRAEGTLRETNPPLQEGSIEERSELSSDLPLAGTRAGNGWQSREVLQSAPQSSPAKKLAARGGSVWTNNPSPNTSPRNGSGNSRLERQAKAFFANLPNRKAFKILAPATDRASAFEVDLNGQERLFSASANKVYILCERMRQLDSPAVEETIERHKLTLDKAIWSPGSPVFNPPELSGLVSERTTLEAMITHSDNTATDMILKEAGAGSVRQFVGSLGLRNTSIPDSTRALAGYLLGATNYRTITWDELDALPPRFVHPALNDVETLASSANDFVSFYQPALEGKFFRNAQTLVEFRRILSLGDITSLAGFTLGASVFGKAGYFDIESEHARCIAGGMFSHGRWIYFAAIINWNTPGVSDPATVTAFYDALRNALALVP